jgi:hypothetical protein
MATAPDCNSSHRSVPSGKPVVVFAHRHVCACGEVCICANDPCWRELSTNAGLPPPWSWKYPACRLEVTLSLSRSFAAGRSPTS